METEMTVVRMEAIWSYRGGKGKPDIESIEVTCRDGSDRELEFRIKPSEAQDYWIGQVVGVNYEMEAINDE